MYKHIKILISGDIMKKHYDTKWIYLIPFTWFNVADCYINCTTKDSMGGLSQLSIISTACCEVFVIIYAYVTFDPKLEG